jgi:mycothiol synthase
MENNLINPSPPNFANLAWRPTNQNDLEAVVELAKACFQVDGGLFFLFELDAVKSRYFPDRSSRSIGAFLPDGRLAACSSVYLDGDPGKQRAKMTGQVRSELRNRGIGTYLMRWSQAQARDLLAGVAEAPGVMQVATETLTESADRLYLAHGFESVFEELVMRRDLHLSLPDHPLPPDVAITHWQPDLAEQFFQAYHASFRERPGFPGYSPDEWIAQMAENDHKPEWTLLASVDGAPVGFVIGYLELSSAPPGGYIGQIGIVPAQRRRGLASALLVETMRRMQAAGVVSAQLTVHVNNPGAIRAYSMLGFTAIGRRARYEKFIE